MRNQLSIGILTLGAVFGAYEFWSSQNISSLATVLAASIALAALVYSAISVQLIEKELKLIEEQMKFNNRKEAVELISKWSSVDFSKKRRYSWCFS